MGYKGSGIEVFVGRGSFKRWVLFRGVILGFKGFERLFFRRLCLVVDGFEVFRRILFSSGFFVYFR